MAPPPSTVASTDAEAAVVDPPWRQTRTKLIGGCLAGFLDARAALAGALPC